MSAEPAAAHEAKHPYHLVDPSPWPIVGAIAAMLAFGGAVMALHDAPGGVVVMIVGTLLIIFTMYVWWRDVVREATFEGYHNPIVQLGMRYGMVLFIASEVMFFVAWFWAFSTPPCSRRRRSAASGRPRAWPSSTPGPCRSSTRSFS